MAGNRLKCRRLVELFLFEYFEMTFIQQQQQQSISQQTVHIEKSYQKEIYMYIQQITATTTTTLQPPNSNTYIWWTCVYHGRHRHQPYRCCSCCWNISLFHKSVYTNHGQLEKSNKYSKERQAYGRTVGRSDQRNANKTHVNHRDFTLIATVHSALADYLNRQILFYLIM